MAKTAVDVKQDVLTKIINDLEASQTFSGLNALWNAAAKAYNATPGVPAPITFSVVYQRVKAWKLPIKTQPGKKRSGGEATSEGGEPSVESKLMVVVSDKVRIVRQDRYNVVIEKKSGDTWKQSGFHSTFEQALIRLLDSSSEGKTAQQLIDTWNGLTKRIIDAVAAMKVQPVNVQGAEDSNEETSDDQEEETAEG